MEQNAAKNILLKRPDWHGLVEISLALLGVLLDVEGGGEEEGEREFWRHKRYATESSSTLEASDFFSRMSMREPCARVQGQAAHNLNVNWGCSVNPARSLNCFDTASLKD